MTRRLLARAGWPVLAACAALSAPGCRHETANASPVVGISRSPAGQAIVGVTQVLFTAAASDPDGDALTLSWDFGDGQTGSGAAVTHVYSRSGVFPVSLEARDSRGGVATEGTSVTVGDLSGRWLLSDGGQRFYESGFLLTQADAVLGGWPYSVPDKGCLGEIRGRVVSPREMRFEFVSCDGDVAVVQGTVSDDLRSVPGTFTHPEVGVQPIVLTRD